jgi:(S)-ureidoglycine aminohydrolase
VNRFGFTRSAVRPNHALISPDAHVRAPLPRWEGAQAITLISPQMGARFSQTLAELEAGGSIGEPEAGLERFLFVMEGEVLLRYGERSALLGPGGYGYLPPETPQAIEAERPSRLLLFEKRYEPQPGAPVPEPLVGREADVAGEPYLGDEAARLQVLLPNHPAFDVAVNLFTFDPGAAHPFVEVHVMEHGLQMLQGGGIYRLDASWYPVQAGDTIWMGPYCAQWFCAVGKEPARYLYYKDVNRNPLR